VRAAVLTAALAVGGLSACTGSPGATESGSTSTAGRVCGHLGSVVWGHPARTRVVTDASLVTVEGAGRRLPALRVAGLGPLSPRALASTGPAPAMSPLMASLSAVLPVSGVPGPEPEPVAAFDVASLRAGSYVTFTGPPGPGELLDHLPRRTPSRAHDGHGERLVRPRGRYLAVRHSSPAHLDSRSRREVLRARRSSVDPGSLQTRPAQREGRRASSWSRCMDRW